MNILFLCKSNSTLSQMAEGLAKAKFSDKASFESAGAAPLKLKPEPFAIEAMKEIGIDISRNYSKGYDKLPLKFIVKTDYIITICSDDSCPDMASRTAKKITWKISDPSQGTEKDNLEFYRVTRDEIRNALDNFIQEIGL